MQYQSIRILFLLVVVTPTVVGTTVWLVSVSLNVVVVTPASVVTGGVLVAATKEVSGSETLVATSISSPIVVGVTTGFSSPELGEVDPQLVRARPNTKTTNHRHLGTRRTI